jgi:hypothetical protein
MNLVDELSLGEEQCSLRVSIIHIPEFITPGSITPGSITPESITPTNGSDVDSFVDLRNNINWKYEHYFKRHICCDIQSALYCRTVQRVLAQIQVEFKRRVVGLFANYYLNGNDYAPYHADKYGCDVVLVSFGATRTLRYKHNDTSQNTDFVLRSGDLLYIPEHVNLNYKHSLLKTAVVHDARISLLVFLESNE